MELHCSLTLDFGTECTAYVGDYETGASASAESTLGYHSSNFGVLTMCRKPGIGQYQVGSLTGAVASERVTEALKG